MVKISLTFLCAFPSNVSDNKSKSGKSKKEKKPKKEKKGKNKKKLQDIIDVPKPENCIIVQSINNFLHIEYNLLPNKPFSSVDVVSWGPVTKVGLKDEITLIKSMKIADYYWIAFTVDNTFSLNHDDVINLKTHIVNINVYLNKSKIPDKLKNDKTTEFFVSKENVNDDLSFCNAYIDENEANSKIEKSLSKKSSKKFVDTDLSQSLHNLPVVLHRNKILSIVKTKMCGNFVECLNNGIEEYVFVDRSGKKGKKGKKAKAKKGGKGKKSKDLITLNFAGELLFTDSYNFSLEFQEIDPKLTSSYILISVSDLLTPVQIDQINPLIVKVDKIENFPDYALLDNDFVSVYATCEIENLFSYPLGERYISNNIYFKNHRVHFLNEYDPNNYIEAIQWGNLTVTIYGRRQKSNAVVPTMFGTNKRDGRISRHLCRKGVENDLLKKALNDSILIPLCVCIIKLDSLSYYSPAMILNKLEHCVHPGYITVRLKNLETKYVIDTQHLNPVTSDILLSNQTSLDIEIRINKPFKIPQSIRECKQFYKRIVLVIYNKPVAKTVLTQVLTHNHGYLGEKILIPNFHTKGYEDDPMKYVNVITGFVIDFDDLCIMFLEGLCSGIIKNIWLQMKFTHKYAVKTFFNSDLIYTQRLYGDLIHYGGIYTVTLQFGFCITINNKNLILRGTHSINCMRAIQKLVIIRKLSVLSQVNHDILPTVEEIKELNRECGVPLINQKLCACDDCTPII